MASHWRLGLGSRPQSPEGPKRSSFLEQKDTPVGANGAWALVGAIRLLVPLGHVRFTVRSDRDWLPVLSRDLTEFRVERRVR